MSIIQADTDRRLSPDLSHSARDAEHGGNSRGFRFG
ncbi:hypothetical protein POX_d06000 [Penicillium oxalicum]|nr:hypothetical protein POX_d06000 [Penicillium oxalicum]KAI2790484.1 hypothetical protein POX_d06000 [Penicillium oxalicum]